jgi:EAL domain-containing protein (putative c-di-GMP-specific phosphodiesterase class I)
MVDPVAAEQTLQRLHTMGVAVAIDDFGTGYSSLAYLKRFTAQTLKLDRSFVHGLAQGTDDLAIAEAVLALAQRLNMTVVAEGVETATQLQLLQGLGCDMVQGFHLGRPMSAAQLAELLPPRPAQAAAA